MMKIKSIRVILIKDIKMGVLFALLFEESVIIK